MRHQIFPDTMPTNPLGEIRLVMGALEGCNSKSVAEVIELIEQAAKAILESGEGMTAINRSENRKFLQSLLCNLGKALFEEGYEGRSYVGDKKFKKFVKFGTDEMYNCMEIVIPRLKSAKKRLTEVSDAEIAQNLQIEINGLRTNPKRRKILTFTSSADSSPKSVDEQIPMPVPLSVTLGF